MIEQDVPCLPGAMLPCHQLVVIAGGHQTRVQQDPDSSLRQVDPRPTGFALHAKHIDVVRVLPGISEVFAASADFSVPLSEDLAAITDDAQVVLEPPVDTDRLVGLFEQFQQQFSLLSVGVDFLFVFGRHVALGELQKSQETDSTVRPDGRLDLLNHTIGRVDHLLDLSDRLLLHLPVDTHSGRTQ